MDQRKNIDGSAPPAANSGATATGKRVVRGYSYYVLSVLCCVYGLNFLDRQVLNILIDPIEANLHTTDLQMGLLTGFGFVIFYLLFGIPIARWADLGSRRLIVTLGLTVWSVMTALSGLAGSFWQLAAARIGVGIGEAGGTPASHSLISDYFPRMARPRALAIYESSIYVGVFLGYLAGGWVSQIYGWRTAFFIAGLPGLAVAGIFYFTIRDPERGVSDGPQGDISKTTFADCLRFMATQRSLLFIVAGITFVAFANFSFGTWAPSFLRRIHPLRGGEIGTWLGAINGTAGVIGTLLGGFAVSRLRSTSERWIMFWPAIVTVGAAPALAGFLLVPSVTGCMLFYWLANLLLGFHLGPAFAMVQSLTKANMRSLASAITNLLACLVGAGLGPLMVGAASDTLTPRLGDTSIEYALLIPAFAPIFGTACFWCAAWFIRQDLARTDTAAP